MSVGKADVDAELNRMAERNSRIETVEREAKNGDTVVIDFEGFVDGKAFEGGKAEKYNLHLGTGAFIPGFEDQLVGTKAGDEKAVEVTFPEDYNSKELAGKAATFQCKVHEVKETIKPELDDEFAKDVSEFDTLADLKKDIKARLTKTRQEESDRAFEDAAVDAAAKNMTVEIPACMIDEQVDRQMEQFGYQLQMQGMKMEDYAKMMGGNVDGLRQSLRPMAEQTVRTSLLLEADRRGGEDRSARRRGRGRAEEDGRPVPDGAGEGQGRRQHRLRPRRAEDPQGREVHRREREGCRRKARQEDHEEKGGRGPRRGSARRRS